MHFIDRILEFLTDQNRQLSTKAAFVVLVIVSIILVDNIIGFTYHYRTTNKIEEIQKVNAILKDSSVDSATKNYAIRLRAQIIERKNAVDYLLLFFTHISSKTSTKTLPNKSSITSDTLVNSGKQIDTYRRHEVSKPIDLPVRNNFLFLLTSGGVYILIAIFSIPLFLLVNRKTSLAQRVATGILLAFVFAVFAVFFYWLFDFIPLLSKKTWIWNYLLNAVLQIILTVAFTMVSKMNKL